MLLMEPDQIAFPLRTKSGNHHWRKGEKVYENYSWSHLWGSNGLSSLWVGNYWTKISPCEWGSKVNTCRWYNLQEIKGNLQRLRRNGQVTSLFQISATWTIKSKEEKDFERITTWFSSWVYKLRVRSGLDGSCEWKVSNSTPFCYIKTALFFLFWLRNRLIKSPTFYTFTGSWDKFFSPVWNTAINNWVYHQA